MASEKLAVIVTVLVGDKVVDIILFAAVSVKITVGPEVSIVKVILSIPITGIHRLQPLPLELIR